MSVLNSGPQRSGRTTRMVNTAYDQAEKTNVVILVHNQDMVHYIHNVILRDRLANGKTIFPKHPVLYVTVNNFAERMRGIRAMCYSDHYADQHLLELGRYGAWHRFAAECEVGL